MPSHRPSAEERTGRLRLATRQHLVRAKGDLVRFVRSTLAGHGVVLRERSSAAVVRAVRELTADQLPTAQLEGVLRSIEALDKEIDDASKSLARQAKADPAVQILMTADHVGVITALAFHALIGDPNRFDSGRQVAAYVGLTPSVHNSGDQKNRLGRISKHGDKRVRSLLVEAAHSLLSRCHAPSHLRDWGLKLEAKIGRKKTAVAVARKLCVILWAMWKKGQPFDRLRCAQTKATPKEEPSG